MSSLKERNEEMRNLRFQKGWTQKELSKKYSISRQRIQQIVGPTGNEKSKYRKRIIASMEKSTGSEIANKTGLSLTTISVYRKKTRHLVDGKNAQMGFGIEEYVSRKLNYFGIENNLMVFSHPFDILTKNNLRIEVIGRNECFYSKGVITSQYRFPTRINKRGNYADFFILVVNETKDMFVIPYKDAPKTYEQIIFCWPEPNTGKKSKWLQYHERFDLIQECDNE